MPQEFLQLLRDNLTQPACGFSVGGFGALAEFQDDNVQLPADHAGVTAVSDHGALRVRTAGDEIVLAYETLGAREDSWQYGVSLVADRDDAAMGRRDTLAELGPDLDAIHQRDRASLLFDLGTGMPHIDYCVRTSNEALVALLRDHLGESVVRNGHPVMDAIIDASPARVVRSRAARIEVYQRIDRHQTPWGPHTHLLPELAASGRSHSANAPLPPRTVPLLTVHPENPLLDTRGERRAFRRAAFDTFEDVLARFGSAEYVAEKRRVMQAVREHTSPDAIEAPTSRVSRLARRIALRQLGHMDVDPAALAGWQARRP